MLLVHCARPAGIARAVSPPGELFVASVVIAMLLVSLGDALDPALFGEAGLEAGLFDLGGELPSSDCTIGISCSSCWRAA